MERAIPWKYIACVAVALAVTGFLQIAAKLMPETVFGWLKGVYVLGMGALIALAGYLGQRNFPIRTLVCCLGLLAIFECLVGVAAKLLILELLSRQAEIPLQPMRFGIIAVCLFGLTMALAWYEKRYVVQSERNLMHSPEAVHFYQPK